jgi:hypothetical protein
MKQSVHIKNLTDETVWVRMGDIARTVFMGHSVRPITHYFILKKGGTIVRRIRGDYYVSSVLFIRIKSYEKIKGKLATLLAKVNKWNLTYKPYFGKVKPLSLTTEMPKKDSEELRVVYFNALTMKRQVLDYNKSQEEYTIEFPVLETFTYNFDKPRRLARSKVKSSYLTLKNWGNVVQTDFKGRIITDRTSAKHIQSPSRSTKSL